jgi:Zn-dependent protease with chaperone function/type II secretory pathway pseudopilin PulG
MNDLIYPRERTLGRITLVLGVLIWVGLIAGTFGGALVGLALGFVLYLFLQSTLISYLKGNGVELSESQFPDLYAQFVACCDRLEIKKRPEVFILNGNGGLNAFATQFLGTQYVVLMSDVVDAMDAHEDGVRFYIGHELGHLRMKHLRGHLLRWPALWVPLLGAAYSRARESTCDRHGRACSSTAEGAARALAALATGGKRWQQLSMQSYADQAQHSAGFWMSFHELTAGYPWLTKRAVRVLDASATMPKRHGFAYVLAAFVPYAGRLGAGFGMLMMVYLFVILAAVAVPAYQAYGMKAKFTSAIIASQEARNAVAAAYQQNGDVPESLESLGIAAQLSDGSTLAYEPEHMTLTVRTPKGDLIYTPKVDDLNQVNWACEGGEGVTANQLPPLCQPLAKD